MRALLIISIALALPLCIAIESLSSTSSINNGIEDLVVTDSHSQPQWLISDYDEAQRDGNDYADEGKSSTRRALMKLKALMQHNRSSKGRKAGKRREGGVTSSLKSKSRKGKGPRTRPTKVEIPSLTQLELVGNEGQTVVVNVQEGDDKENDLLTTSQFDDFPTQAPNNNVVKTLSPTFNRPEREESFIPTSGGVDFPTLPPAPFFFDPDAPTLPVSPPTNDDGGGGTQPSNRPPSNNNNGSSIDYYTKESKYSRDDGWNVHTTTSSSSKSSKRGRPWRYYGKSSKSSSDKSGKGSSGKWSNRGNTWWSGTSSSSKSRKGRGHGRWSSSKSSKA